MIATLDNFMPDAAQPSHTYAMADAVKVIDGAIAAFDAEPVADVVAWSSPNEERTCDIRWRHHDVAPGPLYAVPLMPASSKL